MSAKVGVICIVRDLIFDNEKMTNDGIVEKARKWSRETFSEVTQNRMVYAFQI
jgi:hypothetical protein